MRKIMLLFLLTVLCFNFAQVRASTNNDIFFEKSSYFEEYVDFQGKIMIKELTKKEYKYEKVKQEKINEDKIKKEKELSDNYEIDPISIIAFTLPFQECPPMDPCDPDSGGGSGDDGSTRTSLVYTPNNTETNLLCTENNYYYCEGSAERNNPMTKLHLVVYYDPQAKTGMRAKVTLTWDGAPNNSIKDYLSISYDGLFVSASDDTIIGKQYVVFDEVTRFWWGGVESRTEHSNYEEFNYDSISPDFQYSYDGVIFNISKVYIDYNPSDFEYQDFWPLYKADESVYSEVEIISAEYSLEFDVDLKGTADSYEDINKISFAADYRHTYLGLQTDPKLTVRAYFTSSSPAAFMNLDLTLQIVDDGSRRITLDLYN